MRWNILLDLILANRPLIAVLFVMFEFEERFLPVTETTGGGPTNSTMSRSVAALDIVQADGAFIIGYLKFIISCWRNCLILDWRLVKRYFWILTRLSFDIDESERPII